MKTKNIILLGTGVVLGYLAVRYHLLKKAHDIALGDVDKLLANTSVTECESKWTEKAKTMRPASAEALAEMKADFITDCNNTAKQQN